MKIFPLIGRVALSTILAFALFSLAGCGEDCEEEHQLCLAKIKLNLNELSYEETCRYPSMNSGDTRTYCECEDDYRECKSD